MLPPPVSPKVDARPAPALGSSRLPRALLWLVLLVQGLQAAILAFSSHAVLPSNMLQTAAAAVAAVICLLSARQAGDRPERLRWLLLALTCTFWTAGQLLYLVELARLPLPFGASASEALWLALALPIFILAASPSEPLRSDPVGWLDAAQSCVLFAVMFVLVYPHPGMIRAPASYDVENMTMAVAVLMRFSITPPGKERDFYRSAVIFTSGYALFTLLDDCIAAQGVKPGSLIDLCWSAPFTLFSAMTVLGEQARPRLARWSAKHRFYQQHLHGFTALGMAVMALVGSAIVARHSLLLSLPMMVGCFGIFAARTSTRELQLHRAHARLEYASLHDSLTGLANRAQIRSRLTRALAELPDASRQGPALLFIDLDRFKTINDGLGHGFGDLLLVEVARLLGLIAGPGDLVARYGGDEFVLLLAEVDKAEASAVAQQVVERLRHPLLLEGRIIHVTASVGVVLGSPEATAESMLQDADCAMHRAKISGKDRVQRFAPRMLAAARNKIELETALRRSLTEGKVEVHYQPIYGLPDQGIRGFEALARWRHPERGMISPEDFIPIAEDTGLILELGRQVMRRACFQCAAWNERLGLELRIGVNVSAHQFSDPSLLEEVFRAVRDSRLDPKLLRLEITESVLVNRYRAIHETLNRARAQGIGVCLDDFGTGYSSLSYLLRFPFDVIKIDRSFVRHLDRDPRRAEMVRMILQMARSLRKQTVAEGVESAEELARLKAFGADMVQGFLLSRPLTPIEAEGLLLAHALRQRPEDVDAVLREPVWPRSHPGQLPESFPLQAIPGQCASFAETWTPL